MKKLIILLAVIVLLDLPLQAAFLLQPNDVLGIGGDSITEQHIYSAYMEDYLLMCQPTPNQKVIQFGWGGEGAPSFLARLNTDVFPFNPTVMTTCYGMNDGLYGPINPNISNTYRTAQTGIVEALKNKGVRATVLGSAKCVDSFYFHRDKPGEATVYNQTLASLADIDKEVAAKEGVIYADVYGTTLDVMKKSKAKFGDDYVFGGDDGVHPHENGHLVMAYAFLKALGCDGAIGTITVDYGLGRAEGTPGQEIVSCQNGMVTVKSTRYPFCFKGTLDSKDSSTTAAITTFFPFNQDLNRYLLVVKGLNSDQANVIWGGITKEYSAADLEKGVNLAADFLTNPFLDQFNKVDSAVRAQEEQETLLTKTFMHNAGPWGQQLAPNLGPAFDQIVAAGKARHDALFQAAVALVIPIQHTIEIKPIGK